jgi:hypothetical protein
MDENDIYAILGYYDYLFQSANVINVDEMASIGFVMDPIKKNDIFLVRSVDEAYWARVWDNDKYVNVKSRIEQLPNPATSALRLRLTIEIMASLTMPNIALTNCNNFDMRLHRNGKSFYVNKNIVVYSVPSLGETITKLKGLGVMSNRTRMLKTCIK